MLANRQFLAALCTNHSFWQGTNAILSELPAFTKKAKSFHHLLSLERVLLYSYLDQVSIRREQTKKHDIKNL